MKFSLLHSLFFFTIILQASWCLAAESTNGEKLAKLPQSQAEEETTKDVGQLVSQCTSFSSFWGPRKVGCTQTNSIDSKNVVNVHDKYPRKLKRVVAMQTMGFSHKGGAGGGGGGGGGGAGTGGGKGGGGNGAESVHQQHKKHNNAISLAYPRIYILLEIGIYIVATVSFTLG